MLRTLRSAMSSAAFLTLTLVLVRSLAGCGPCSDAHTPAETAACRVNGVEDQLDARLVELGARVDDSHAARHELRFEVLLNCLDDEALVDPDGPYASFVPIACSDAEVISLVHRHNELADRALSKL